MSLTLLSVFGPLIIGHAGYRHRWTMDCLSVFALATFFWTVCQSRIHQFCPVCTHSYLNVHWQLIGHAMSDYCHYDTDCPDWLCVMFLLLLSAG